MPDDTNRNLRSDVFERNVAALAPSPLVNKKGGILIHVNYKSFVVNIRPPRWQERFWIGQIDNYVDAQFIADLVYYYIGQPCFHLKDARFEFPPLQCAGTPTPLTTRSLCFDYAASISKGRAFLPQRIEFRDKVKKLALEEVKSVQVQRILQRVRDENTKEDALFEQPVELGHPWHLRPLLVSFHDAVGRKVDGENVHVPGFEMSLSGFRVQSAFNPVESSWVENYLATLEGCPSPDAEDFCSATEAPAENSCDDASAFENFGVHFFAMEDSADFETGESSSNFRHENNPEGGGEDEEEGERCEQRNFLPLVHVC